MIRRFFGLDYQLSWSTYIKQYVNFHSWNDEISTSSVVGKEIICRIVEVPAKGQLISKWFFCVFDFFQKAKEHDLRYHSSKVEFVCLFLEETSTWKNHFDFVWPSPRHLNSQLHPSMNSRVYFLTFDINVNIQNLKILKSLHVRITQIRVNKGFGHLVKSNLAKCKWHNRLISFVVAIPQLYRVSQRILLYNCRNRFNEAAVAAAVAAGFDGAAAAAVAVSTSFLNESDREVKAEPREPGTVDIY